MQPLDAVALVYEGQQDGSEHFLGTCFAFRYKNRFLTAHHCVAEKDVSRLSVFHPQDFVHTKVESMAVHPTADIAVLVLASGRHETDVWLHFDTDNRLGNDFMAYGFPEDQFAPEQEAAERSFVYRGNPTARLFKGYFQRYFNHRSRLPAGYQYRAGEMSIGCPAGLSGGPLFRPMSVHSLCGLVTENFESATVLHWKERAVEGSGTHTTEQARIINYGVCVMLSSVADWLEEHCPFPK